MPRLGRGVSRDPRPVNSRLSHPRFIRGLKTLIVGSRLHLLGSEVVRGEVERLADRTLVEFRRKPWRWLDRDLLNGVVESCELKMGKALLM